MQLLEKEGVPFERVDYFVEPLDEHTLRSLLKRARLTAREVLRTREKAYRELGLDDPGVGEDALVAAMVRHPGLLQRPIVVRGERAVLARPVERVRELF